MKNNKVVVRGEEKLYISAANSKRLLFPYPPSPTVFFEAKEKMTPPPPRSRLTTIPHLFYSYIRRGVISTYLAKVVCLPKTYTYIVYILYSVRLSSQYSGREQLAIYLILQHSSASVYVYDYNFIIYVWFVQVVHATAISMGNVQNFSYNIKHDTSTFSSRCLARTNTATTRHKS